MLTKSEFLAAVKRETKILTHLAGKLDAKHLEFRLTPAQRSTRELLQFLTIGSQASVAYFITGTWDLWGTLDAQSKSVDLATFAKALKKQEANIARMLKPVSDRAFATRQVKPVNGKGTVPLAQAVFDSTLAWAVGYRMQLFLQAKAAGLADLGSSDLWYGKDPAKKKG